MESKSSETGYIVVYKFLKTNLSKKLGVGEVNLQQMSLSFTVTREIL